jgi:hypothetical protein
MKAPPTFSFSLSLDSRTLEHLLQWLRSQRKQIWLTEMNLKAAAKFS